MFRAISHLRTPLRSLHQTLNSSSSSSFSSFCSNPTSRFSIKPPIDPSPSLPPISIISSLFSSSSKQKPEDEDNGFFVYNKDPKSPPKLFVVQPRIRPQHVLDSKLNEALNLAHSLEEERDGNFEERGLPQHILVQNPASRSCTRDTYFGPGTVDTVKCHLDAVESKDGLDAVFVNAVLTAVQQRNLERAWGKPVLDRVGLIIEIFNAHAQTKEAKLQSELAALMYKRTRLIRVRGPGGRLTFGASGESEVVSARGRGSGGRGFISGAGETELQLQRRRIIERRSHLLTQIEEVRRTRALQRASRRRRGGSQGQGLVTVAVVGYTNAGKSTLVSALSDSDLYSDDRLFATVDPRLRNVVLPSGRKVLLSDTVGFISDLPVQLVEAFHATLEEVVEADLLVHVLDSSAPNLDEQRSSVLEVLQQIGVPEDKVQNMIEVWNKIDLLSDGADCDELVDGTEDDEVEEEEEDVGECEMSSGEFVEDEDVELELSTEENLECTYDHEDSEGWKTVDDQQGDSTEELKTVHYQQAESLVGERNSHYQPQDVQRLEISAVMGVGLQELLTAIDEKLSKQNVVEKRSVDFFDRKWRPPKIADGPVVGDVKA